MVWYLHSIPEVARQGVREVQKTESADRVNKNGKSVPDFIERLKASA